MFQRQASKKPRYPPEVSFAVVGRLYFWLRLLLLAALLLQQILNWRWPWLADLQADNVYKQFSGFALLPSHSKIASF